MDALKLYKNRWVATEKERCFNCKYYQFKFMLNVIFDTGHECNGICMHPEEDYYYTCSSFLCTKYEKRGENE